MSTAYHPAMAGRIVSPTLVGRATEMTALAAALDGAAAGSPIHQLVAGEAGVGKSRLSRETASLAAARGFVVLEGGCADIGDGGVPYGPIVEAFRTLVRGLTPAGAEAVFGESRADLARLVPALGQAAEPASPTEFLAPRLLDAILGVLQRLAETRPVLFVLEDLHWADVATREALAYLVRQLGADPVLLLMTFRDDELHRRHPLVPWLAELERSGRVERTVVSRLGSAETGELLASILGEAPSPELAARVHRRSDGNPFFVEELVGAGARAAGPIPPTLREVLLSRIVALPDDAQSVVRVAAVAGRRVDHDLLALVAGMADDALIAALRTAVGSQVLVTASVDDVHDGDYAFRHALLQEAAYDDLLPGERQRIHRAFGEALAARGPGSGAPAAGHWAELAWHWSAARDLPNAFEASVRAADAATRAFAFADAQRHGERALELWPAVADAEARAGIDKAELLDRVAQAAWLSSDSRRAVAHRKAAIVALEDAPPLRQGIAQERLGRALWYNGEAVAALEAHEHAIALIPEEPPTPELARVLAGYGQILMLLDNWPEATEVLTRAVAVARQTGARQAEGHARNSLGLCLAVEGRAAEGYASLEAALVIAHELEHPDDIGRAYVNLGDAKRYAGDPAAALEVARRGIVAAQEFGLDRTYTYFIRSNGIQSAFELDAWDEAAALAADSVAAPDGRVQRRYGLANWLPLIVAQGDPRATDGIADLELVLRGGTVEAQFHVPLRLAQAEHALWAGDHAAAIDAVGRSREELGRLGTRWYEVRLLRVGIRAAAVAAEVARARRDATAEAAAIVAGDETWAALEGVIDRARAALKGLALDEAEAELALATAERTRLRGPSDAGAWRGARDHWARRGNVYLASYCGLHLAEASLVAGDRPAAATALVEAHGIASHLGAEPLRRAIEGLAARGRIDLDAPAGPEAPTVALPRDPFGLTPRERDVLPLLVQGRTNRQIAETLFITENTAGVHVSNILGKLGASTRTEAAAIAARLGIG